MAAAPACERHRLDFDEGPHVYKLDGTVVPSVTEIIKPLTDYSRVPEHQLEYKRSLGKAVHKAIALWEEQDLDVNSMDPDALPFFEAWLRFKEESGFRAVIVERPVASVKLRCAGTPDVVGTRITGDPDELLDVKCVWTMERATGVQTAIYADQVEEWLGIKIKRRGGVQLLRDGSYRFHPYADRNDMNLFRACHAIHAWKGLRT
jgi:hypothetical protein